MKHILLVLMVLFASYITFAGTVDEFSFKELGYSDFYIRDFNSSGCTSFDFINSFDLNGEIFPIVSVYGEFAPNPSNLAKITVFLNGEDRIAELQHEDFRNGVAHVFVPRDKIIENNNLRVCGQTSFTVNTIKIS